MNIRAPMARVVFDSFTGAFFVSFAYHLRWFGSDQQGPPSWALPVSWGLGAAIGAVIGAAIRHRRPAPLSTFLGTAVAVVPLVLVSFPQEAWRVWLPVVLIVPIVGACIGNALGQRKK